MHTIHAYDWESISHIINANKVDATVMDIIQHQLVETLARRYENSETATGTLTADDIYLSRSTKSIKLTDTLNREISTEADDVRLYGEILHNACTTHRGNKRLRHIANKCIKSHYSSFYEVSLSIERNISNSIYIPLIIIICTLLALLAYLNG